MQQLMAQNLKVHGAQLKAGFTGGKMSDYLSVFTPLGSVVPIDIAPQVPANFIPNCLAGGEQE